MMISSKNKEKEEDTENSSAEISQGVQHTDAKINETFSEEACSGFCYGITLEHELNFLILHFLRPTLPPALFQNLCSELQIAENLPFRLNSTLDHHISASYRELAARHSSLPSGHLLHLLQSLIYKHHKLTTPSPSLGLMASRLCTLLHPSTFSLLENTVIEQSNQIKLKSKPAKRMIIDEAEYSTFSHPPSLNSLLRFIRTFQITPKGANLLPQMPTQTVHRRLKPVKTILGHLHPVYCLCMNPTRPHFYTGADDCLIKVWELSTSNLLFSLRGSVGDICDLATNRDGTLLGSIATDRIVRLWDVEHNYAPLPPLLGHLGDISTIVFGDGILVTGDLNGVTRIWSLTDLSKPPLIINRSQEEILLAQPSVRTRPNILQINAAIYSNPKDFFIIAGTELSLVTLDTVLSSGQTKITTRNLIETVAHSGHVIYPPSLQNGVNLQRERERDKKYQEDRIISLALSHDGHRFLTGSKRGVGKLWCFSPRKSNSKINRPSNWKVVSFISTESGFPLNTFCFTCDDSHAVCIHEKQFISVFNTSDGARTHTLPQLHTEEIYVLAPHPRDPRIVLTAGYDGVVILWDIIAGVPLNRFEIEANSSFTSDPPQCLDGSFSPCGDFIVITDNEGKLSIFTCTDPRPHRKAFSQQFFENDFAPIFVDAFGVSLDQNTMLPPHELPPTPLCDVHGEAYANQYLRMDINDNNEDADDDEEEEVTYSFDITRFEPPNRPSAPVYEPEENSNSGLDDLLVTSSEESEEGENEKDSDFEASSSSSDTEGEYVETSSDEAFYDDISPRTSRKKRKRRSHRILNIESDSDSDYDYDSNLNNPPKRPQRKTKRKTFHFDTSSSEESDYVESSKESPPPPPPPQKKRKLTTPLLSEPVDWVRLKKPFHTPYVPQLGDLVYYFPLGHVKYLENQPWAEQYTPPVSDYGKIECTISSIEFAAAPVAHCILRLEPTRCRSKKIYYLKRGVRYHPSEDPDYLILKNIVDDALKRFRRIKPQTRIKVWFSDEKCWYYGKFIRYSHPNWIDFPWESIGLEWDPVPKSDDDLIETENHDEVSPWEVLLANGDDEYPYPYPHNLIYEGDDDKLERLIVNIRSLVEDEVYDSFGAFRLPADYKKFPDYLQIIASPIDLRILLERIENGYYRSKESLLRDIELLKDNCKAFNDEKSAIYELGIYLAVVLKATVNNPFKKLLPPTDRNESDSDQENENEDSE